jgi:hypothetical protein
MRKIAGQLSFVLRSLQAERAESLDGCHGVDRIFNLTSGRPCIESVSAPISTYLSANGQSNDRWVVLESGQRE